MKTDPASRRARNVVLLVIVTVALPSLVLTALGVAAIRNEEVAAKRRMERLYRPVLMKVARDFNVRFDRIIDDAEPALFNLLEWSDDQSRDITVYREFLERHPAATNFFILDDEGSVMTPTFDLYDAGACCSQKKCLTVEDFDPIKTSRCSPERREQIIERLVGSGCDLERLADDETLRLARKLLLEPMERGHPHDAIYIDQAAMLAARLGDPTRKIHPEWGQKVARAMMYRFEALDPGERRWAGGILAMQSTRQALLEGLGRLARTKSNEVVVAGLNVDSVRRLVVLLNNGDRTAGFELVAAPLERDIQQVLVDDDLDESLVAHVGPLVFSRWWMAFMYPIAEGRTKEEAEKRLVTWVLSNRSNLNWAFELEMVDGGLISNLGRSRSSLYLWALILVGSALLGGIVYTVRSVIQEAHLSRLKTDFVSSVSHDLRTPLTSIRMFSETLRAGRYESESERHEFLQIIIEEAERLSRLTERILDFSRMEAGKKSYRKRPTDLSDLVHHALKATQPMIDAASFQVEVDIQDDLPPVPVDHDAMLEVLINLYSNAIKYSPDNNWMGILVTAHAAEARISVRDNGIGIRKADHCRIFEKFYRVDNRRSAEVGGSGIGLSLVKHIVDTHGGAVEVQSAPGQGSTFIVRLPIEPDNTVDCSKKAGEGYGQCSDRRG